MIAVTGLRTTIVHELHKLRPDESIERIDSFPSLNEFDCEFRIPSAAEHFVLAAGVLHPKRIADQAAHEISASLAVNLVNAVRLCELILERTPNARIVVIGSESAFFGSYDDTYFLAKAALHRYVQVRKVLPEQLLACLAPPIIADSGMTRRRSDYPAVLGQRKTCTATEVAVMVEHLLYDAVPGRSFVRGL